MTESSKMRAVKVLLIQNSITHYNLPIYNILAKRSIILTVAHFDPDSVVREKDFTELLLHYRKIGPFFISTEDIYSVCGRYDVVICLGDLHWLSLMFLGFKQRRTFKLIYWGIGVSASYKNQYDKNKKWDFVRYFFMRKADALIFYSQYPIEKYTRHGFIKEKLFVAHNTVSVSRNVKEKAVKDSILFIGKLYKEKGIFELLDAYKSASLTYADLPFLIIIGDGDEYKKISDWIIENNLKNKITMMGAIYDDEIIENYFLRSLVCISPSQAGLSVLKSMAFGVPFVTRFDAITGGEKFNIKNNETGIIYYDKEELVSILKRLNQDKEHFLQMGINARKFYDSSRNPEVMVKGFTDAIEYVVKN